MIANKKEIDTSYLDAAPSDRGMGGYIATAVVSAAVGAGVALLFAPQKGVKTRKQVNEWVETLELGAKLGALQTLAETGAKSGAEYIGSSADYLGRKVGLKKKKPKRNKTLLGAAGAVAALGLVSLIAPEGNRRRVGRAASSASSRFGEYRRTRRGEPLRSSFDQNGQDQTREPRTPVRMVQETAQDETKAF